MHEGGRGSARITRPVLLGDHGLMIAARGRTIVSTYGLSDDAFDALARHLG